jgi:uncharacterized protein YjbI with pentapeptide repeats
LNIFRADLKGKWLAAVSLRDAYARLANLDGADLRGANLWKPQFSLADMLENPMLNAIPIPINAPGVHLEGTDLRGTNLEGVALEDAHLQGAKFQGANLQGANLEDADLEDADLQGANLQGVKNLTYTQLEAARTDAHTQLPDELRSLLPPGKATPPSGLPEAVHE